MEVISSPFPDLPFAVPHSLAIRCQGDIGSDKRGLGEGVAIANRIFAADLLI